MKFKLMSRYVLINKRTGTAMSGGLASRQEARGRKHRQKNPMNWRIWDNEAYRFVR